MRNLTEKIVILPEAQLMVEIVVNEPNNNNNSNALVDVTKRKKS